MTEVEFEQVYSIKTSLEEIARQLKIANTMKAIELRTRGVPYDEAMIDPDKNVPRKDTEDDTSTCVDTFTDDRPYWFR